MTSPVRVARLDDLPRLRQGGGALWRPIRRTLDLNGVSANAYTGVAIGDEVIEPHDETSQGAAGHEELYVVISGAARFEVEGERFDAPSGSLVRADVGERRQATALEPETTILVFSGEPGSALPPAAYEYWYAAEPHYVAGEYDRGIEVLAEGLEHHPESPGLNYQLACYHALAGRSREAIKHLRIALAGSDGRVAEWAAEDEDLDSIRADPDFPKL